MQHEIAMVTGRSCNGGSLALHTQCSWWRVVSEGDLDLICSPFELLLEYFRPRERRDKNLLRTCYVWSLANSRFTQLGNAVWPFSIGPSLYPQRRGAKEHLLLDVFLVLELPGHWGLQFNFLKCYTWNLKGIHHLTPPAMSEGIHFSQHSLPRF